MSLWEPFLFKPPYQPRNLSFFPTIQAKKKKKKAAVGPLEHSWACQFSPATVGSSKLEQVSEMQGLEGGVSSVSKD